MKSSGAKGVTVAQKEPFKLLADDYSCLSFIWTLKTFDFTWRTAFQVQLLKKQQPKGEIDIVPNADTTSEESSFVMSRSDVFHDEAVLAVKSILLEKKQSQAC